MTGGNSLIIVEKERIADIPVLHVAKQDIWKEVSPLVIFIHGFGSAKEHNLHYAYLLAEKGFRVILPDVAWHGEREEGLKESQLLNHFWPIVVQTIEELAVIKDELLTRKLIDSARIGVAGTSLGGIVTNGALAVYDWVHAAVSLMGNPAYLDYAKLQLETIQKHNPNFTISEEESERQMALISKYDLSLQPEKLAGRPLLYWHGAKDPIVPYTFAYKFYESIRPAYEQNKLEFILDPRAEHKVSRYGLIQTAEWFDKHLTRVGQNT